MTRTGKQLGSFLLFWVMVFYASGAVAQDVRVSASLSETNIFVGESVVLDITITGPTLRALDRPVLPETPGLRWLPNQTSRSTNYTYQNGRPSVTQSYGFVLIAEEVGSFTFPGVEVKVNGETYTTNPINFKVLDPKTIDSGQAERAPDIYVRIEPDITDPVVGQQVIANVVLYFKNSIEVSSYQASPGWKAEGFWKEELETQQRAQATSVLINGIRYQRARLLQYALFPTKAGELTLSPFEVTVRLRQTSRNQRDIFSLNFAQESKELRTLPVTINVRPVPQPERGELIGAVGDFEIQRSIKPSSAYVGESVEIITTISGKGNVPLLNKLEYEYPDGLEQYTPQESSNITRTNQKIAGFKSFIDIVIARNEGTYTIPGKEVAIYNPDINSFEYIKLPPLTLTAEIDPKATTPTLDELRLNVKPLTGLATWESTQAYTPLHKQPVVWTLLGLPFVLLLGALGCKTYFDKLNNDHGFARSRKARAKAVQTLSQAEQSSSVKDGYHLIEQALHQYISDKLNLPEAGLSSNKLIEELRKADIDFDSKELKRILTKCETIAYAPNITQEALTDDLVAARELIKQIEKAL